MLCFPIDYSRYRDIMQGKGGPFSQAPRVRRYLMFHKIKGVTPLPDFILSVQFSEGVTKHYDMNSLFDKYPMFAPLKSHPELYYSASVDTGGYGIVWNDDIDSACDELFVNSHD